MIAFHLFDESIARTSLFAQDLGVEKQIGVFVDALPELEAVIKPAEIQKKLSVSRAE